MDLWSSLTIRLDDVIWLARKGVKKCKKAREKNTKEIEEQVCTKGLELGFPVFLEYTRRYQWAVTKIGNWKALWLHSDHETYYGIEQSNGTVPIIRARIHTLNSINWFNLKRSLGYRNKWHPLQIRGKIITKKVTLFSFSKFFPGFLYVSQNYNLQEIEPVWNRALGESSI